MKLQVIVHEGLKELEDVVVSELLELFKEVEPPTSGDGTREVNDAVEDGGDGAIEVGNSVEDGEDGAIDVVEAIEV